MADHQRFGETSVEGIKVTEQSPTRRELEASIRQLLPEELTNRSLSSQKPTVAAVGLGGLMTGYLWGWIRGRRARARRSR